MDYKVYYVIFSLIKFDLMGLIYAIKIYIKL